ncbi:MAG: hypothetical protein H6822_33265 [Planctomycetaceae bacterium]|nr:hypothetical protein [Planctomycetales bacterium]MCB9927057.1 hypothetical protein [Planctomycetaceae bacterium]
MTLKTVQSRFREIAEAIGSNESLRTTAQHDGSAHAEQVGDQYFYVVTERGSEFERRETSDPEELLSWFVRDLTSVIAGDWELKNRAKSQDSRRLRFAKHVELLRGINNSWANQQQSHYQSVLLRHPFDDASSDRVDYYVNLQKQGIEDKKAWQLALARFPEPKAT